MQHAKAKRKENLIMSLLSDNFLTIGMRSHRKCFNFPLYIVVIHFFDDDDDMETHYDWNLSTSKKFLIYIYISMESLLMKEKNEENPFKAKCHRLLKIGDDNNNGKEKTSFACCIHIELLRDRKSVRNTLSSMSKNYERLIFFGFCHCCISFK